MWPVITDTSLHIRHMQMFVMQQPHWFRIQLKFWVQLELRSCPENLSPYTCSRNQWHPCRNRRSPTCCHSTRYRRVADTRATQPDNHCSPARAAAMGRGHRPTLKGPKPCSPAQGPEPSREAAPLQLNLRGRVPVFDWYSYRRSNFCHTIQGSPCHTTIRRS